MDRNTSFLDTRYYNTILVFNLKKSLLLLLLSRFSRVRLCATPRRQPTRLPCPWDSPGKNTGVDCHCLLQCMKVKSESEVAQSCPTLPNPMDCSLPASSVRGICQARVLDSSLSNPRQKSQSLGQVQDVSITCTLL